VKKSLIEQITIAGGIVMDNLASSDPIQLEKRKHQRYCIPSVVTCRFPEELPGGQRSFQGFVQDISLGGVFLEIRDDFLCIKKPNLGCSTIEMTLECTMPEGVKLLAVAGNIKWHKRIKKATGSFLYLRIQFHTMDERNLKILKKFLSLGTGDKHLFWNLWDTINP
jgi:hypothetical protein